MNPGLAHIDWRAPWLAPCRALGEPLAQQVVTGHCGRAALNVAGTAPVRFVPQADLPPGMAYEQFIHDTGCVPTRDGLHDFFNGLCWMRFPRTKRLLNRLQAAEIQAAGVGPVRGPVRDALTLFDENAALLQAPDALWDALLARDWQRLFVDLRPLWAQARLDLFGHALLEKLVAPYKSITAHVYRAPVPTGLGGDTAGWDAWLEGRLSAAELGTKPFTPLPVLGVPGWWPANEDPAFYTDAAVFRPARVSA
ncbi:DUF3025 domain-containing protein [Hydrogenophaga taeniospiralis]|uniref:DUF3025 domain-containing protein n=1 Tax=Hydrogenophaga taeniospiralis TaxID=65656 RepID=UPI001CF9D770|nr:DUF3025 domain-containing protein [Hydrogenophaga taeniospiralis]MCB4363697.1 DUF3025 domain-containing protein [Hydrogenophaga taeniospiralis]